MRLSGIGVLSSVSLMPTAFVVANREPAIVGTWMKFFSRSMNGFIICGGQWTRMEMYWIVWSRAAEIRRQPRSSFASF